MATGSAQILLQSIIRNLFPKNCGLVSAFGYGSVAVPQHGRSVKNSQLDFILIVKDPQRWHLENCRLNPQHYSGPARLFGGSLLTQAVTNWPHPAVFYNPLVTWHDPARQFPSQVIKYGVVDYQQLKKDLTTWSDLYIAGRLHKPVVFVPGHEPPSELKGTLKANLRSALAFSLLELDLPIMNEDALYHSLASISYRGDWRLYFGEDRRKIERLITGETRRHGFRELYLPFLLPSPSEPLSKLFEVEVPPNLKSDLRVHRTSAAVSDAEIVDQLLRLLPEHLCQLAATGDANSARQRLAEMSPPERRQRLRKAAASIVRGASYRQTLLGLFSAGLSRSFVYSLAKFRKMLASLSA